MKLKLAREAHRLHAKHSLIIEALLALKKEQKHQGVSMVIEMLTDLVQHGQASRYLVKMKGSSIWELKSTTRGGQRGGSRVYLFMLPTGEAGIVTCEVKENDEPDPALLVLVLKAIKAFKAGIPIFKQPPHGTDKAASPSEP